MMKLINKLFLLTALSIPLLFYGCEKVIDLELENAAPAVVIDGGVSDQNEAQVIKISKTYSFTEANRFNGISGAIVGITSDAGDNYRCVEKGTTGVYESIKFRGKPGLKYTLNVTLEGKSYTASSVMPNKVKLDSLTFKEFSFFGKTSTYIAVNYNDPAGIQNNYRFILKVKGKIEADVASEDRFNDGNKVADVIFHELNDLVKGDTLEVEFQCIDRNVFKYFFSMEQNSGGGGPPVAPANPPSNLSNGALGIFNAHTSGKIMAEIK